MSFQSSRTHFAITEYPPPQREIFPHKSFIDVWFLECSLLVLQWGTSTSINIHTKWTNSVMKLTGSPWICHLKLAQSHLFCISILWNWMFLPCSIVVSLIPCLIFSFSFTEKNTQIQSELTTAATMPLFFVFFCCQVTPDWSQPYRQVFKARNVQK